MTLSEFQRVFAAEVVSNFGSMLSRLVIPLLATLSLAVTPLEMGLLVVADVFAAAVGSLLLGVAVDHTGKRSLMLATDVARAVVLASLAWLAFAKLLSFWMLVLAAAAGGLLTVTFELARSAWIAHRVATAQLATRNAQLVAGSSLAETAAFALGGWLYQWLGALAALLIDAISYLASALFLRTVNETTVPQESAPPPRAMFRALLVEASDGVAAVVSEPRLSAIATIEILLALGSSLAGTSYMIFVARELGFDIGVLGMIFATGGVGSLIGAGVAPRLGRRFKVGDVMLLGLVLLGLGALCVPLAPGPTIVGAALLIAQQVVGDAGHAIYEVHDRTLRQTCVAPGLVARADAGIRTLGQFATLAGAIAGGAMATVVGTRQALVVSAALYGSAAVIAYIRLSRRGAEKRSSSPLD